MEVVLGEVAAMPEGHVNIVRVGEREYGVVRWGAEVYVVRNRCPHQLADFCSAQIDSFLQATDRTLLAAVDQPVLACPWHGWEFDLRTGRSAWGDSRWRLWTRVASIRDGVAYVQVVEKGGA